MAADHEEDTMTIERFPVEAGHIMLFARAIGDANPVYYGALTGEADVTAPPTFVQASAQFDPDYFLRPKIGQPWFGSGRDATGVVRDGRWQRGRRRRWRAARRAALPVPPPAAGRRRAHGDRPRRRTVGEAGRPGGKLLFSETITEYRDQAGELVVTARAVGVRTEKVVETRWLTIEVGDTPQPRARRRSHPHADRPVRRARPATTTRCTPTTASPRRSPATRRCSPTACSPWA